RQRGHRRDHARADRPRAELEPSRRANQSPLDQSPRRGAVGQPRLLAGFAVRPGRRPAIGAQGGEVFVITRPRLLHLAGPRAPPTHLTGCPWTVMPIAPSGEHGSPMRTPRWTTPVGGGPSVVGGGGGGGGPAVVGSSTALVVGADAGSVVDVSAELGPDV